MFSHSGFLEGVAVNFGVLFRFWSSSSNRFLPNRPYGCIVFSFSALTVGLQWQQLKFVNISSLLVAGF